MWGNQDKGQGFGIWVSGLVGHLKWSRCGGLVEVCLEGAGTLVGAGMLRERQQGRG